MDTVRSLHPRNLISIDVITTITANISNHGGGVVSRANVFLNCNFPSESCLYCPNRIPIKRFGICQVKLILLRVCKCDTQIFLKDHSVVNKAPKVSFVSFPPAV